VLNTYLKPKMNLRNKEYYLNNKNTKLRIFRDSKKFNKLINLSKIEKYSAVKLASIFECDKKTILRTLYCNNIILPNLGRYKKRIYCNEKFFNKLTKISAYWAGFIAADGCLFNGKQKNLRIGLNKLDKNHLIKFKKAVKTNAKICNIKSNNSSGISIYSVRILDSLIKLGIMPNKSLKINKVNVSPYLMSHFIRGVFDGDGSISGDKVTHIQFCIVGNKPFLEWIQDFLVDNCKLNKVQIYPTTQGKSFRLQYTGIQIFKILDFLYQNSDRNIRLDRKYDKYNMFKDKFIKL